MEGEEKKRGGCLSVFLILTVIVNALSAVGYLLKGDLILQILSQSAPYVQRWYITASVIISVLYLGSAVGIWFWRKSGVYGAAALTVITYMISIKIGTSVLSALLGFVTLIILILLVRPIWKYMK